MQSSQTSVRWADHAVMSARRLRPLSTSLLEEV